MKTSVVEIIPVRSVHTEMTQCEGSQTNSTIYEYVNICHSTSWIRDMGSLLLHSKVQSQCVCVCVCACVCVCTCLLNTEPGLWSHKSTLRVRPSVSSVYASTVIGDQLTSLPQSTLWGSITHLEEPEVLMLLYAAGWDHNVFISFYWILPAWGFRFGVNHFNYHHYFCVSVSILGFRPVWS